MWASLKHPARYGSRYCTWSTGLATVPGAGATGLVFSMQRNSLQILLIIILLFSFIPITSSQTKKKSTPAKQSLSQATAMDDEDYAVYAALLNDL